MKRKKFVELVTLSGGAFAATSVPGLPEYFYISGNNKNPEKKSARLKADVVIAGGGLGGCAAALAALRNGLNVILTEETDWIGGQLTSQGVPPDEHQWIETHGSTGFIVIYAQQSGSIMSATILSLRLPGTNKI